MRSTIAKTPSVRTPPFSPTPQAAGPCSWACRRLLPYRPKRNETQSARPLFVGRVLVYPAPKALAGGTAALAALAGSTDPVELGADGGDGDLYKYRQEQDGTLDGIVDQRVQAQGRDDLVNNGVAHGAKEHAQ